MKRFLKGKFISAAISALLVAIIITPCSATNLEDVKKRGKLIMLCFPHQESIFIRTKVEVGLGHYDGIDYDLMKGFAEYLGVSLEVLPVKPSFAELIPALLAGKGDVIASSFSITPKRKEQVDFSNSYFELRVAVLVDKTSNITSIDDLKGKVGSAVKGSSQEEIMKNIEGINRIYHVAFTRWNYDAVSEKKADFTLVDEPSTWKVLPEYPDLKVAFTLPSEDKYGFAVTPGSDLREHLNRYIDEIKRSSKLEKTIQQYMPKK
jgi:ABC-type amino acid transport substrate-binding protein